MDKRIWPPGISPDGAGLRIRIWDKGRVIYTETLKGDPHSPGNITAAKERRRWLLARHHLGLPLYEGEIQSTLFEDVAQSYLTSLDAKHSTHMTYETTLNYYWMPHFTGFRLEDITMRMIKEKLALHRIVNKTKRNILIPLRGIFDHAEMDPNPCRSISLKRRQSERSAPKSYTLTERDKLMAVLPTIKVHAWLNGQPEAYFALLFGAGLRPGGEPLALHWSDFDGTYLTINKQITGRRAQPYTKTDRPRKVYIPMWVRSYLQVLPSRFEGGYIFRNAKNSFFSDSQTLNRVWAKAHVKARVSYQVPYACRHTRASELLSTGIQAGDAAQQLGHSIEMFHRTYAEWIAEFAGNLDPARFEGAQISRKR